VSLELAHLVAAELGMNLESVGSAHAKTALDRATSSAAGATDLRRAIVDALIVPESWFFREPKGFEVLRDRASSAAGKFRVLCAPCARGEEAWSAAMAIAHTGRPVEAIEVVGVDVSGAALRYARAGHYERLSLRGGADERITTWTTALPGGAVRVGDALRRCVDFEEVNLTRPLPWPRVQGPFDVIFCRNLMVYLTEEARAQLLQNLRKLLAPAGVLIAASSDSTLFLRHGFGRAAGPNPFVLVPHGSPLGRKPSLAPPPPAPRAPRRPSRPPVASAPAQSPSPRPEALARALAASVPKLQTPPAAPRDSSAGALEHALDHARALANVGLHEEALTLVRELRASHAPNGASFELEASLLSARDDLVGATEALLRAVELEPDRADLLMQLAAVSERRGRREVAHSYRERATALRGGHR